MIFRQKGMEPKLTLAAGFVLGVMISWHHTGYAKSVTQMAELMPELLTKPSIKFPKQQ